MDFCIILTTLHFVFNLVIFFIWHFQNYNINNSVIYLSWMYGNKKFVLHNDMISNRLKYTQTNYFLKIIKKMMAINGHSWTVSQLHRQVAYLRVGHKIKKKKEKKKTDEDRGDWGIGRARGKERERERECVCVWKRKRKKKTGLIKNRHKKKERDKNKTVTKKIEINE